MSGYKTISCSVTGYQKKVENRQCEDATKVIHTSKGTIISVADGHGDRRCLFSSIGAKLAVKAICDVLKEYLKRVSDDPFVYWNTNRYNIAKDIIRLFSHYVVLDYKNRYDFSISDSEVNDINEHIDNYFDKSNESISAQELREKYTRKKNLKDKLSRILFLYGTTVRASLLTDKYIFNCSLGDGDTIAIINGNVEWLLPKSESYASDTASLCEPFENVVEAFMFSLIRCNPIYLNEKKNLDDIALDISTLILSTDGLRNSFVANSLFERKIKEISDYVHSDKKVIKTSKIKSLYNKLSMDSIFQDDISTVIAIKK